jgi:hypothetical protein
MTLTIENEKLIAKIPDFLKLKTWVLERVEFI